jgi:hypothetical protein
MGCVDSGLLEERLKRGDLMHQRLEAVAAELWGADVDAEGIALLRDSGFQNLFVGDIIAGIAELEGESFDVIVLTEVLEHLDNPGLFLDATFELMQPGRTDLVVTVPNAYRIDSLLSMWNGVENIHPDHNYWFSYYTVTNLLRKRGFEIAEVMAYSLQPGGLLPDRLGSRPGETGSKGARPADGVPTPPLVERASAFVRSLPRRFLVSLLYRRSPFWADGIMVVARRSS